MLLLLQLQIVQKVAHGNSATATTAENSKKLNGVAGSEYFQKNSIAKVKGTQSVTVDENTPLDCTFNINYPTGFSKDNCIVLAFATRFAGVEARGFSFGTRDSYNCPGAFVETAVGKAITFLSDKMVANLYYAYGNLNHPGNSFSIEYEVVLMKLPT